MVWVFQCLQKGLVSPGKQSTIMQNREIRIQYLS